MQIAKRLNTYDIEELYPQCQTDDQLRLPISMNHGGLLGVDASLAQLVISWARVQERSVLHLYANSESAIEQIPQLARTAAGLAALIMCTSIESETHEPIEKRAALTVIRPLIEAMYEGDLKNTSSEKGARPKTINLFCINNARMEFIKPFYYGDSQPKVHPRSWFSALIEISSALMHTRHEQNSLLKSGLPALGGVLAELISNADEHSVTDVHGVKYKKGLRGTSIKSSRIRKQDVHHHSKTEPEFARFIVKNMVKGQEALDFLEISIIDSGPGLARRWISAKVGRPVESLDTLPIEEELQATLDCFKKHVTSKDSSTSGMGLHNAIQALNKLKAFVRLRTGRLCLYQTFQGHDQVVEYSPKKWSGDKELTAAEGTVFTICIPVN
ncbi:ATP-binding protein [Pseudomonas sp. TMW22080]|mgnify:CR=1 FL=1|uniref:ATP-binding protein n=1 Tax=Pseudomonas sp. TMW22080 TaxID=2506432 RepID=UPI001F0F3EB3|nr:ATP-binding protein [Pseudomonas sp. TMW22080]MCH4883213.1 ATP-binding protein [Pseudomonas sp. TMW22080]